MRLYEWCIAVPIACVLLAFALLPLVTTGPDFDRTHRFPPARRNSGDDLAEIAGEYVRSGRFDGRHLSILPDGRYSYFYRCCTGVGDREAGYAQRLGDTYLLSPTVANESKLERSFLPIRWKDRLYLIEPERMYEFCIAIIDGDEPGNDGYENFYLRSPIVPVDGVPDLPEHWAMFLKQNLVIGRIVKIMEGGRVKIDLGSAKGIATGHVLAVQGRDRNGPQRLLVVSVETETCIAEEVRMSSAGLPLEVGRYVVMQR
jgi:hypothetical protein